MESSLQAPIIEVEGLTARFGDNTIFERVSFQVNRGEILVILGGSGCGKSTLLKHLIGLYQPAAGKVILSGIDMRTDKARQLRQVKMGMGVLQPLISDSNIEDISCSGVGPIFVEHKIFRSLASAIGRP